MYTEQKNTLKINCLMGIKECVNMNPKQQRNRDYALHMGNNCEGSLRCTIYCQCSLVSMILLEGVIISFSLISKINFISLL